MVQSCFVQSPGELFRIGRFNRVGQLYGLARLVGLKMADEMELGFGQSGKGGMLVRELLHVILAEHAQAQGVGLAQHRGGEFLRHRDQRDLFTRSTRPAHRRLDAQLDLLHAFLKRSAHAESQEGMDAAVAGGTPWAAPSTTCRRTAAGISLIASANSSTVPRGSRVP